MRAILTYHSIDPSESVISIDAERFRRQMEWLAESPVQVVELRNIAQLPAESEAVALTFDDGFVNFGWEAWPVLRDLGLPATLFVVTDGAGGTNAWEGEPRKGIPCLPLLDWSALGAFAEEGVALGSHSRTHARLDRLEAARIEDEVLGSAERIRSETGTEPASFAYPFGATNPVSARLVRERYACGCTTELRALDGGELPELLPRLDMYYFRSPGQLEAWGSGAFRRRLWLRSRGRHVRGALATLGGHA